MSLEICGKLPGGQEGRTRQAEGIKQHSAQKAVNSLTFLKPKQH